MSMGLSTRSAESVINNFNEKNLKKIIKILGEEKEAARIAKNILNPKYRKNYKVDQLVKL